MILTGSRYSHAKVLTVDVSGKPRRVVQISPQQAPYAFSYVAYQMKQADTLPLLAFAYYGDATQWWQIADANPQVTFWGVTVPGTIIRIPVLS
jgi:nucleoid-associated protein YgaU